MPVPGKHVSKRRTRSRRSHHALKKITTSVCANCQKPVLPHHVCMHCGFYRGQNILNKQARVERKLKKKEKSAPKEGK